MSRSNMPRPPGPDIVTREYIDQLLFERYRAQPAPGHKPSNGLHTGSKRISTEQLEREIMRVTERLDRADEILGEGQRSSKIRGRAVHDFNRDR